MSSPQKIKKIEKTPKEKEPASKEKPKTAKKLGRTTKADTIRVFECYNFVKSSVELTDIIFKYIEEKYVNKNFIRSDHEYQNMISSLAEIKDQAFRAAVTARNVSNNQPLFKTYNNFYNFIDYFKQSLDQLPKHVKSIDASVGNPRWN